MSKQYVKYAEKVVNYYKACIQEEAKTSAFTNIKSSQSKYIKFTGKEKFLREYPTALEPSEQTQEVLELLVQRSLDKTKQLVYGYLFVKGETSIGKQVYTPLFYIPVEVERVGARILVNAQSSEISLNIGAISEFVKLDEAEHILKELVQSVPTLPLTDESVQEFLDILHQYIPSLTIQQEKGLILANTPAVTLGMLNDMEHISKYPYYLDNALAPLVNSVRQYLSYDEKTEEKAPLDLNDTIYNGNIISLDKSQEEVIDVSKHNRITAVIGGPGCGKSRTITGLVTHFITNGMSVLVASKMNEAVDVVYEKLDNMCFNTPKFAVRTGNKEHRKELASFIEDLVAGKFSYERCPYTPDYNILEKACNNNALMKNIEASIKNLEDRISGTVSRTNPIQRLFKLSHWKNHRELNSLKDELKSLTYVDQPYMDEIKKGAFLNRVYTKHNWHKGYSLHRKKLITLAKALKEKPSANNRDIIVHCFDSLIKAVPCWCSTINEISSTIPCISNMFDVAIIDEASQCDIASCIPILYRAKRVIVVGDDKQLRYLSFLDNRKNLGFMEAADIPLSERLLIDYKKNSMYDFAVSYSDDNPVMLKTHYRSKYGDLIAFSNKKFYGGQLQTVKEANSMKLKGGVSCIEVKPTPQCCSKGLNYKEAKAIVTSILDDILSTKDTNGVPIIPSIGVVTPFRAQANLIEKMLQKELSLEKLEKHKVKVGTAHTFQGSERDIMYVSWVVNKTSHVNSFTFINNDNLFNVAITRAKYFIKNYYSMPVKEMPKGLLREYLEFHNAGFKSELTNNSN